MIFFLKLKLACLKTESEHYYLRKITLKLTCSCTLVLDHCSECIYLLLVLAREKFSGRHLMKCYCLLNLWPQYHLATIPAMNKHCLMRNILFDRSRLKPINKFQKLHLHFQSMVSTIHLILCINKFCGNYAGMVRNMLVFSIPRQGQMFCDKWLPYNVRTYEQQLIILCLFEFQLEYKIIFQNKIYININSEKIFLKEKRKCKAKYFLYWVFLAWRLWAQMSQSSDFLKSSSLIYFTS